HPSADFLLLIQHVERLLLEEPEVLVDLRLHRVGLGADLVGLALGRLRLFTGRLRGPAILLGCTSLVLDFFAELLESSHPVSYLGIAGGEVRLSSRRVLLHPLALL